MARSTVVVLLLTLAALIQADNFIETVGEYLGVEFYEFEGERYGIFTQPVMWDEAYQMCPARQGILIDYETPGLAEFIARALAESAVSFGSLWIAGRLYKTVDNGSETYEWKWAKTMNKINVEIDPSVEFPQREAPFWVNTPPDTYEDKHELCLGTDRFMHHLPLIVPVDCSQQRPYICKLEKGQTNKPDEVLPVVETKTKTLHLFRAAVTWAEALSECRLLGMKLAKLTTLEEFTKMGHKMLRIRPVMENAWIGGYYHDDKWTWTSSNEDIKVTTIADDEEPAPWYRKDNIIMEGCLLADRHLCDHFVYVEAKCDRRRNFICEQLTKEADVEPFLEIDKGYWISSFTETWPKASLACVECLNGELLKIEATADAVKNILPILYKGMAITVGKEIRHIWVGGHLFGDEFVWTNDGNVKPEPAEVITADQYEDKNDKGVNGILVYCKVNLKLDTYLLKYQCLNLDRENQKNFFMYGLSCDLKQHFFCKTADEATIQGCALYNKINNSTTYIPS